MIDQIHKHHSILQKDEIIPVRKSKLIELSGVTKAYTIGSGQFLALKGIDMQVNAGEFVAVVGKSGSGKSTLINMITGIDNPTSGEVFVASTPVHALNQEQLAVWRGKKVGIVFQFFQLLPTLTVVEHIVLPMDFCNGHPARERRQRAIALLEKVGIAGAAQRLGQYPHQLSGGLRQRVMIAMALMCGPDLLIADEPSTALDVTIQAQILRLLADLQRELGIAMVLITHDLGVVARIADRVAVMYAGQIVEEGPVAALFGQPRHPYTRGLMRCIPVPGKTPPGGKLGTIPGIVPALYGELHGCAFRDRCEFARPSCSSAIPVRHDAQAHRWRCVLEPGEMTS